MNWPIIMKLKGKPNLYNLEDLYELLLFFFYVKCNNFFMLLTRFTIEISIKNLDNSIYYRKSINHP